MLFITQHLVMKVDFQSILYSISVFDNVDALLQVIGP